MEALLPLTGLLLYSFLTIDSSKIPFKAETMSSDLLFELSRSFKNFTAIIFFIFTLWPPALMSYPQKPSITYLMSAS